MSKIIFCVSILVCLISGFVSFGQKTGSDTSTITTTANIRTVKLKVKGINCIADCKDIQKEVSKLDGIVSCSLKGTPGAVTAFNVSFDASKVSEAQILAAVAATPGCTDPESRPYKGKL